MVPLGPSAGAAASVSGAGRWASHVGRRVALDKLIAAHARARDVILVTNNPRDFASYPDLRIENWVE